MKPLDENIETASDEENGSSFTHSEKIADNQKFNVEVLKAVKDGDTLNFTIKSLKGDNEEALSLQRFYEDFEWLHHCLTTQNDTSGLIVPPLPVKPEIDAKSAENKSRRQLGSDTNILIGDEFQKECQNVEKYLRLMLSHDVFQKDQQLIKFLSEVEAPTRVKLRKGIMDKLSNAVDEVRKGNHKDVDEYFQKTRDWANNYTALMKETSENYNKMVYAQYRLAGHYCHFSTTLNQTGLYKDVETIKTNRIMACFSLSLDDYKHELEVLANKDEQTLGFLLELYARYMDSVKEMLFRRTCLLVDFENANRLLEKAKPPKKQQLKSFIRQRLTDSQEGFISFAETQIKTARNTYALLAKHYWNSSNPEFVRRVY
ncbi:sorting nexin-5-like isoform X2 [Octopus vulgaris]|uniref:Sorting nexin-5-like isoform X2 n=1 Tax=Octopus vulgaris TaxID=6645 RepID=A0AA36BIH8_OCTVU|nr:sorting nexin-5-like isoform X2 [Octopus vulgaris]